MRQEESLADLLITQARCGQHRNLALLRRERVPFYLIHAGSDLPGRPELTGGPGCPWPGTEAFEDLEGSLQMPS
jgi:hypothetical protein